MNRNLIRKIVSWSLLALVVLFLVTGFGITQFRIVESLTGGLLDKNLSFNIHTVLWIPLLILLSLHIYLRFGKRK